MQVGQANQGTASDYQPYEIPTPFDSTMNQDLPQTKCFIESQAGSPFAIRFKISPLFSFPDDTDVLIISVFVDGKPFDEKCIPRSRLYGADYMDKIWYLEEADRETVNTDLERIKALGTIQVAVQVAKRIAPGPVVNDFHDDKRHKSLTIVNNALVLNGHGRTHGTSYIKTDESRSFKYTTVDNVQYLGNFFFFYLSRDSPEGEGIFDHRFINQYADDMFHPASCYNVTIMSNGWIDNEYTGDQ
ncbi:uncharacterized protein BKA55DRAFT_598302 [Fusarium redolens]|uniref:Uncharacterized protein n=1 Tax=Fusarium redolens TaxID=48865 RepID=A0A9P9G3B8_FUSRE|nr:uncharacterized protein BKA55DRAFT_598302 [Fusarium redolens]KAH7232324.1 hypothetical protein BKA55DRAFT_598302 [Fusarium redolens]